MRQIVLDTETTGLSPAQGHRITEIGCVELFYGKPTGRKFQTYINPEREVSKEAEKVSGLNLKFLSNHPTFAEAVDGFMDFLLKPSEKQILFDWHSPIGFVIHNAPFDLGFLNHELKLLKYKLCPLEHYFGVADTLKMARTMKILQPGQKNTLDTLCAHYEIDNSHRKKVHGALLDAELLAEVYLAMTAKPEFSAMIESTISSGRFLC